MPKTKFKIKKLHIIGFIFVAALLLTLGIFLLLSGRRPPEEAPEPWDPFEGMVQVADGMGGLMWAPLHEELPVSNFKSEDFCPQGAYINYMGTEYQTSRGVDVSFYQGEIDWGAVKSDGVDFAMIRAGYRGYCQGDLYEDELYRQNIEGALAQGIRVGVYFFSQATSRQEAAEEAQLVLSLIEDYDISLPVAFDWEQIGGGQEARTDQVTGEQVTDYCLAFCETIQERGYDAAVYFYRSLGYLKYDLPRLAHLTFWVGALGEYPDFYYDHGIWQYSCTGMVKGIEGEVDLNIGFFKARES